MDELTACPPLHKMIEAHLIGAAKALEAEGRKQTWAELAKAVAAMPALTTLQAREAILIERVAKLEDEVVTLWHQTTPDEDRSLSECLGMSDDEYAIWATGVPKLSPPVGDRLWT